MSTQNLFTTGKPARPDVDALMKAFPVEEMEAGSIIKHEEVMEVINVPKGTQRYRTITTSWRNRLMREYNVDTQAEPGIGYIILRDDQRVDYGLKDRASSLKKFSKALNRIVRSDETNLSDIDAQKRQHAVIVMTRQLAESRKVTKEIATTGTVFQPPRALPPPEAPDAGDDDKDPVH